MEEVECGGGALWMSRTVEEVNCERGELWWRENVQKGGSCRRWCVEKVDY